MWQVPPICYNQPVRSRRTGRPLARRVLAPVVALLAAAVLLGGPFDPTISGAGGPSAVVLSAVHARTPAAPADTAPLTEVAPTTGAPNPATLSGYVWPLALGRLTLPFGPTVWGDYIVDGQSFHDGLDIATFCGDHVVAAHSGIVLAASRHYDAYMGWRGDITAYEARLTAKHYWDSLPIVVVVDDLDGYWSIYAHFNAVVVSVGQRVQAGQFIGYEGNTGRASGCHVHYGLFSPLDTASFGLDPIIAAHMLLPEAETARVNPLLVLPYRADIKEMTKPWPTGPRPADQASFE